MTAKLALSDGTVLTGALRGFRGETGGELCFNTSISGYQEIATDPSYVGQIMMMTYPHIGNYGANEADMEARKPMIEGLVVRSFCDYPSNAQATESFDEFLKRHKIVAITDIDTRRLVRHIRTKGVMNAIISGIDLDDKSLIEKAKRLPDMSGRELASKVSTHKIYDFAIGKGAKIAVYDFGVKLNILRSFADRNASIRVFPAFTPLSEVLAWQPDGIFFSNGPGDPRAMPQSIETVKEAFQTGLPLFGICLGHQLMALANGFEVYKMYVGHRGANHPVKNLFTKKVEITTQNHGFAVQESSIHAEKGTISHLNLNDHTVEGIQYQPTQFSVQYHPEASPGPHDSRYLFDQFIANCGQQHLVSV